MRERRASARGLAPASSADPRAPLSAGGSAPSQPDDVAGAPAPAAGPAAGTAPGGHPAPRPDLFELLFGDDAVPEPPLPDLPAAAPARPDPADPSAGSSDPDSFAAADPDPFSLARHGVARDGASAAATTPAGASPAGAFTHRPAPGAGQRGPDPDDETRRLSPPRPAWRPRLAARLAAHRRSLSVAVLAAVAAVPVQLVAAGRGGPGVEPAFAAELAAADDCLAAGRIATPAGEAALDHLEAARSLLPEDARLTSRARTLAGTLEALGEHALARGDLLEARAHFTGALRADPGRSSARAKLETIDRIAPRPPGARR